MTTRSRPDRSSSGVKPRPRGGLYSEDLKDGRRYLGAADLLRLSAAGEIESLVARDAAALKAGLLFTPLPVDGDVDGQRRVGFEEFRSPLRKGHELLGWGKSGGWRRTPLTREKMAVLAPIPTASERTIMRAKTRSRSRPRMAWRISVRTLDHYAPPGDSVRNNLRPAMRRRR